MLTPEQVREYALAEAQDTGFGMKDYNFLTGLGATNQQLVEIAMNAPVIGDVARENLLANFDVGGGFGQTTNNQLTRLGATREQIIDIASNAPVIGDRMIEEYPELEKVDYNIRHANLKQQLQAQYDTLIEAAPEAAYGGRQSDIDKIFFNQAKKLADKGVGDLAELGEFADESGNRFVTNRNTGEQLFKINRDRDTGVNKWGDVFSGVKDGANFGIEFDPEGRAVLFPVHEKTKGLAQQLVGRDLAPLVTPIATVAGAYFGGPAGAAAGSAGGQYLTSGEIDPLKVALAAGATYAGQSLFGGAEPTADLTGTTGGMTGADLGFAISEPGLLADQALLAEQTAQLYQASGGDLNAVQQNLIASGVDPIMAADAANKAALTMGQSAFYDVSGAVPVLTDPAGQFAAGVSGIQSGIASVFPGETVFTSQGLLGGGATMDPFARDIANITSTSEGISLTPEQLQAIQSGKVAGETFAQQAAAVAAPSLSTLLRGASLASQLGGGGGQTATGFPQQQAPFQPTGVDYSGIYGLLGQRPSVPGIQSLLGPAQLRYPSLLG